MSNLRQSATDRSRDAIPDPAMLTGRKLSDKDFERLSNLVSERCGIKMPATKKTMLEARLGKRLRQLGLNDVSSYCQLLFEGGCPEDELVSLLDVVTTNTTEFFREPRHYDIFRQEVLPAWMAATGGRRALEVWSAGCSSGQEPYTLAIVLSEYARTVQPINFRILATDISTKVLRHAVQAVYQAADVAKLSFDLKKRYFLRSKDRNKGLVRVAPQVRSAITFARLNFMEDFELDGLKDVIFCRNVLIYFERELQEAIIRKQCGFLRPGGHLFIGHSESLGGMDLPLVAVAPTVYRRV